MGLIKTQTNFNTQVKCLNYLEKVRWQAGTYCPHCGETKSITVRKQTNIYHCNACNKDFTVLIGTIFEHSRLPLPTWFMLISLMLDAKGGISSVQLSEHLEIPYKTAWYSTMRARCAMIENIDDLSGVIEADEMYVGGKPRKRNSPNSEANLSITEQNEDLLPKNKRGRGTAKAKVAGFVERDGRVVMRMLETFNTANMLLMLKDFVKIPEATLVTDEARFYNRYDDLVKHFTINHKKGYWRKESEVKGNVHTNTIEGFWGIIKGGIRGQYKSLSKKYLPFYLAEFAYKYNRRKKRKLLFSEFIETALSRDKCLLKNKPIAEPKQLTFVSPVIENKLGSKPQTRHKAEPKKKSKIINKNEKRNNKTTTGKHRKKKSQE